MTRPSVLVTEHVPPIVSALEQGFAVHRMWEAADPDTLVSDVGPQIRAIAVGPKATVDRALIDRLPALEIIAKFGVGYDTIDVDAAARRGVVVTTTAGAPTDEVADFAMGLLLAAVRQIPQATTFLAEGKWRPGVFFPLTTSLRGRRVGIIGLGRIGAAVARRCHGFDLPVAYHSRTRRPDVELPYFASALELAREVDTLIVTASGGPASMGIVDAGVLAALGPNGVLVNVSRGSTVDQDALATALADRTILTAALDVFAHEPGRPDDLLQFDNVVLTPHVGAGSLHAVLAMSRLVVDNLESWFAGHGPLTPLAETPWRQGAVTRSGT